MEPAGRRTTGDVRGRRPGRRDGRRVRARAVREADTVDGQLSLLRAEIGSNTQAILLTPLCDEEAHRIARRLDGEGAAVTVVSPDVTTDRTAGGRLAGLERDRRLTDLRNAGVPAVDWDPTESLGAALSAIERWER